MAPDHIGEEASGANAFLEACAGESDTQGVEPSPTDAQICFCVPQLYTTHCQEFPTTLLSGVKPDFRAVLNGKLLAYRMCGLKYHAHESSISVF